LPIELTAAVPAEAPVPLSKVVGSVHNTGSVAPIRPARDPRPRNLAPPRMFCQRRHAVVAFRR